MKRILFLLIFCLTVIYGFTQPTSGVCGENLKWTLNLETGVLTISGTGAMTDYDRANWAPWSTTPANQYVKKVIIEDGVTSIGSYGFRNCRSLTSITIPESVTNIETLAFLNCIALPSITIPESVTSIGISAFSSCYSLTSITNLNPFPVAIDESVFSYEGTWSCVLIVPRGSAERYRQADVWKKFRLIIEIGETIPQSIGMIVSNKIIREHMSRKTSPYVVYGPKYERGLDLWYRCLWGQTITTLAGEVIELDYPCWLYYVRYADWGDDRPAPAAYLIVNDDYGSLLEIKIKEEAGSFDLTQWQGFMDGWIKGTDCMEELFYYTFDYKKIFLDTRFEKDRLVVGFAQQDHETEIVKYINQTGLFKAVNPDNIHNSDYCHYLFAEVKEPKTCSQLKELIPVLEQSPFVTYVNFSFGDNLVITDEFVAKLNDSADFSDLEALMQETNTRMKKESYERYIIIADKNSKGNALQMSNYFYETGKFLYAHPNFLAKIVLY